MLRLGLKPAEVAELLGMSVESVYRAVRNDEIVAEKVNGRIVIPAAPLVARFGQPIEVEAA